MITRTVQYIHTYGTTFKRLRNFVNKIRIALLKMTFATFKKKMEKIFILITKTNISCKSRKSAHYISS